jgi:hypothetical protein
VPDWSRTLTADTVPRRRRAVEYSDEYYSRLQLHRWGSWLEFPVFGAEYWLGQKLMSRDETPASWVKPTHAVVAGALGGLFALNTITGRLEPLRVAQRYRPARARVDAFRVDVGR